jgi:hypothetical protein
MPDYRIWCPPSLFEQFNEGFELESPETQERLSGAVDVFQELLGSPEIRVDLNHPAPPMGAVEVQIVVHQVRFAVRVDFSSGNVWLDGVLWHDA